MRDVYLRVKRPEGYEDVHPELVMADLVKDAPFEVEVVNDLKVELAEARALLRDLAGLAEAAMKDAARDGAEYDIDGEMEEVRAYLAKTGGDA